VKHLALSTQIFNYLIKIAQHNPKTISERMKEQDRETVPAKESKDEKALYKELLELLKPAKAPKIDEDSIDDEECLK
jgi:hypothetical protein